MGPVSFRIDLHVHSLLSEDNLADPEECIVRAIEFGLQGLAFTEHYSYAASEPLERLKERYRDKILVVRAVEFSVEEGHCLVFGVDTDRLCLPYAPAAELIREVSRAGGVVIPSHPYRAGSGLGDRILALPGFAAVEGHNGCNHHSFNQRAIPMAQRLRLPVTGGSDAHRPVEVGSCHTVFPERVTEENLVALLAAGNYQAVDTRKVSRGWPFGPD
ncbi:MAG: PHP domain-containing protein [Candidatus Geothermincolia bacterium]